MTLNAFETGTAGRVLLRLRAGRATEGRIVYDLQLPTMAVRAALAELERAGWVGRWGETRKCFALRPQEAAA